MRSMSLLGKSVNKECFSNHEGLSRRVHASFDKGGYSVDLQGQNSEFHTCIPLGKPSPNSKSFSVPSILLDFARDNGFRHELDQAVEDCTDSDV